MLYDLTILGLHPNTLTPGLAALEPSLPAITQHGRLLGCFVSEFGVFNRIAILTSFASMEALQENRAALISAADPYGVGQYLADLDRSAFKAFPFVPPVEPANVGPYFEMRTYGLAWGALEPTIEGWSNTIPKREKLSKLLIVMASLETAPQRMVHIWPYQSLDQRVAVRKQAMAEGLWPPKTNPEFLVSMKTEMFVPTAFSPIT